MRRLLDAKLLERDLRQLVPRANQFGEIEYHELLEDLQAFGVSTRALLRRLYLRHRKAVLSIDREPFDDLNAKIQRKELGDERFTYFQRRGIFYNPAGLLRLALELEHGDEFRQYIAKRYHAVESADGPKREEAQ